VATELVPVKRRMPNALFCATYEEGGRVLKIEQREADDHTLIYQV
jgi:hypothetical protein